MTTRRFRKKPVIVEARQFDGSLDAELEEWLGDWFMSWRPSQMQLIFSVAKGRSECMVEAGDWIIKEPDGVGFYPCTATDFALTYEEVSEATSRVNLDDYGDFDD